MRGSAVPTLTHGRPLPILRNGSCVNPADRNPADGQECHQTGLRAKAAAASPATKPVEKAAWRL